MSSGNRREAARILTEFPLVLLGDKGEVTDQHAVAHDVSDKGFKAETRGELRVGQIVRYRLSLQAGEQIAGRARIAWVQRVDVSYWAGAEFQGLSWRDRKRVRRVTSPSDYDWDALANKAIIALSLLLVTVLGWRGLSDPAWRGILGRLLPEAAAALAMGLALRELFRRG